MMRPSRTTYILILFLCLFAPFVRGDDPTTTIDADFLQENITPYLDLLPDPGGRLTIEEVAAKDDVTFRRADTVAINEGITDDPLWARVKVENLGSRNSFVLDVENPRLRDVQLYRRNAEGAWDVSRAGTDRPFYSRQILHASPAFVVSIPSGESTFYLRIHNSGSLRFTVHLYAPLEFHQVSLHWAAYNFMIIGCSFAMALYNFLIFLALRERAYLYLTGLIGVFLLFNSTLNGIAHMYLWPNAAWWSSHSGSVLVMLAITMAIIFSNSVLDAYKHAPVLSRINLVIGVASGMAALISLTDWLGKYYITHTLGFIAPSAIFLVAFQCWRTGARSGGHFMMAWGLGVVGSSLLTLVGPGLLPSNLVTEHLIEVGFLVAVFLWSFALSDRVVEKEELQRQVLEQEVNERTAELREALSNVKTLEGLLPICASCKRIRDDGGYWNEVEDYIRRHTDVGFSHGVCPECAVRLYPEYYRPQDFASAAPPNPESPPSRPAKTAPKSLP